MRLLGLVLMACSLWGLGVYLDASQRAVLTAPEGSAWVVDRHGAFLGEVGEHRGYWPVGDSSRLADATVILEDRRFREHSGVDLRAVLRAVVQNLDAGHRVSGASTIPMQVARMQSDGRRTLPNKVVEALTAVLLVQRYGHDAVLAHYLRIAPYAADGHGAAYAARRTFAKPLEDLSWAETAYLVALPQAPGRSHPWRPDGLKRGKRRAGQVLSLLHRQGLVSDAELTWALEELQTLAIAPVPARPSATLHRIDDYDGIGVVRASLDLALQQDVQQELREATTRWADRGAVQAAAMVLDVQSGQVIAAVGSVDWHDTDAAGSIDYTRTPRLPGSTLKPLLYTKALSDGVLTPDTVLDDLSRAGGIANADGRFLGPLLPRKALGNSRNVPTVRVMERVGLDDAYAFYQDLGLHDGSVPAEHYGYGLAIGGMPVTMEALAHAYLQLDAVDPVAAGQVRRWLSDPMARLPSFPRGGNLEGHHAVKTGTSPDYRDAWAVGITDQRLVVVWFGHPDWRPMQRIGGYEAAGVLKELISGRITPDDTDQVAVAVCPLSGRRAGPECSGAHTEWFATGTEPATSCDVHVHGEVRMPPRYAGWAADQGVQLARVAAPTRVSITHPADGTVVIGDPDATSTLLLRADAVGAEQVVWYVDDEPFAVVDAPFTARWPVEPGEHRLEARVPFTTARSTVRIAAR